jgi:hypothetical protein
MPNSINIEIKENSEFSQKKSEFEKKINFFDYSFSTNESKKEKDQIMTLSTKSVVSKLKALNDELRICSEVCFSELSSLRRFEKKEKSGKFLTKKGKGHKVKICNMIEVINVESFKKFNKQNTFSYKNYSKKCYCPIF